MIAALPRMPSPSAMPSARCASGRSSGSVSHSRWLMWFATATPSWLRRREKIETVRTASTKRPRPLGSRKRPWSTTSSSASGVESPRKTRISKTFEPSFFAPGTSAARTSSGFTGGVAVDEAASFDVASIVGSGACGPRARMSAASLASSCAQRPSYPRRMAANEERSPLVTPR